MFISLKTYSELVRLSFYDLSTGFYNRNWFEKNYINKKNVHGTMSLAIIDINFLKKINDTFGHEAGDKKIKEVGDLLCKYSRVVRWGGDEFYCIIDFGKEKEFRALCESHVDFAYAIQEKFDKKQLSSVIEKLDKEMYLCKEAQKMAGYKVDK